MKLYFYNITRLSEDEYRKWFALMGAEKQQRVSRFRFFDDRKRTVAGEMLARKAVSKWCDVPMESIVIDTKKSGKPYAVGFPVEFSISHSGKFVVCAVSDKPIGVDIELVRPVDMNVAKHVFSDDELDYLFGHAPTEVDFTSQPDRDTLFRFFELWTKKEADFKKESE